MQDERGGYRHQDTLMEGYATQKQQHGLVLHAICWFNRGLTVAP